MQINITLLQVTAGEQEHTCLIPTNQIPAPKSQNQIVQSLTPKIVSVVCNNIIQRDITAYSRAGLGSKEHYSVFLAIFHRFSRCCSKRSLRQTCTHVHMFSVLVSADTLPHMARRETWTLKQHC